MNILVITPLYYICGRNDLIHDTSAIHYLIAPWAKDNNVHVIFVYHNSIKHIFRYLNADMRKKRNGYYYTADNVKVGLIEVQKLPKQGPALLRYQSKRVVDFINSYTKKNNFIPDVIISHVPISNAGIVRNIFPKTKKIAVFHNTDKIYWEKRKHSAKIVLQSFDNFFARSESLYNFFDSQGVSKLGKDIIYSGITGKSIQKKKGFNGIVNIAFVGKLIPLKNVDIAINAISKISNTDIFFHIIGEGYKRKSLEKLARKKLRNQQYKFYGQLNRNIVMEMLSEIDIFIMVSSPETFGLTYLEAMINGCIPIGCCGEGIDGVIVDGENGFLVKPRSIDNLVEKINHIINMDEIQRNRIITNAISTAERFNEYDMSMKYYKLVVDVCQK